LAKQPPPPQAHEVDWAALSPRSQATLRLCWKYALLGYNTKETAEALGVSPYDLTDALGQLRDEMRGTG
jgi:hypothetical protein